MPDCKWTLSWSDDCNTELYNGLAPEIALIEEWQIDMRPVEPEEFREGVENGEGQTEYLYSKVRSRYRTSWVVTNDEYEAIQYLKQYKEVKITDVDEGIEYLIDPSSIEIQAQGTPLDDERELIITFAIKDSWSTGVACCDSAYSEAPYGSQGQPGSGAGGQEEPGACLDWAAVINSNNLPVLSISESDIPANSTVVIEWYVNGNYKGNGSTIQLGEYGSYSFIIRRTVSGEAVPCVRNDSYIYLNECALYDIQVAVNGGTITANIVGAPNDDTGTWEVIDDLDVAVATSLPHTPDETGIYTVKYTSESCGIKMKTVSVVISTGSTAQHTVNVIHQNGGLHANVNNAPAGTQTFSWTKIDINGNEVVVGGNSADFQPTETGIYRATVTINGDSASGERLWISGALDVKIINTAVEPVITSEISNRDPVVSSFNGSGGTLRLDMSSSGRALPHPAIYDTVSGMQSQIIVKVGNILYTYNHNGFDITDSTYDEAQLGQNEYGIDYATGEIVFEETILSNQKITVVQF